MFGHRTPVTGRGQGASASGSQETTSPSGKLDAPKGISLTYGKKGAVQGTSAETAKTPMSSVGTSEAVAPNTTPSPAGPPGQAPDAARTFIRRPERKRRSLSNMEVYKKQIDTYATSSNDNLLQEVMKVLEEIPSRVSSYPQMRKDIKIYLEMQSDKCQRTLFELSKRVKELETKASKIMSSTKTNTTPVPPRPSDDLLERLENVEASIKAKLFDLEEKVEKGFKHIIEEQNENGADMIDKIVERVEDVGDKVDVMKYSIDTTMEEVTAVARAAVTIEEKIVNVASEVVARTDIIKQRIAEVASEPRTEPLSYANVTAAIPGRRPALHSMAVTMEGSQETADEVLARVKKAVDARGTGLKINKVRKAKNRTVILGCESEAELKKVKEMIESRGEGLTAAPIKNKNPLVVLKDVFLDGDDEEMVKALHAQNKNIFSGLEEEETEIKIKYKKRTRNPRTAHVVVQVRPKVWQRMTEAGALYLDLQRVKVEDQSPLIQCTKCLAFGHGRKFCTESVDRCSHCGGPHLREKCEEFIAGNEPQCCNCSHSTSQRTDHNAFSTECPVRKKWDYLARTTTAYA